MNDQPTKPDPSAKDIATEQRALEAENGPPDSARLPRANRSVQGQPQQPGPDANQTPAAPDPAETPPSR